MRGDARDGPTARGVRVVRVFGALTPEDPEFLGPYRIVARLGAGGMGRVYLGRSRGGRAVAVKVVRPELAEDEDFRRRFAREVAAARQVSGVFTAGVVDADPDGSPPWLATAYVRGVSLEAAVAEHGALPQAAVLALGAGIAEALEAIHAAGVVHRDLKPSNVLLAADGPRVIDFGISAVTETSALTRTGTLIGTPGYMSPEQLKGGAAHPAGDVFSLGAVLVFAATGTGPFGVGSTHGVLFRTVYEEPDLSALPPGRLATLAARCLAKDPGRRPSVAALTDELAAALGDRQETAEVLSGVAWLPPAVAHTLARTPPPPASDARAAGPPHAGAGTSSGPDGAGTPGTAARSGPARGAAGSDGPAPTEEDRRTARPARSGAADPESGYGPPSVTRQEPAPPASPAPGVAAAPAGEAAAPTADGTPVPAGTAAGPGEGGAPPVRPEDTGPAPSRSPAAPEHPAADALRPPVYGPAPPPYDPGTGTGTGTGPVGWPTPPPRVTGGTGPARRRRPGRRVLLSLTALVTAAAVATAIVWNTRGGGDGAGGTGRTTPPVSQTPDGRKRTTTVTIAVHAPLTGDLASYGQVVKNSVDLAVRDANERKEVPGVTFKVTARDDRGEPGTGRRNATELVADEEVLGVVGPVNASVAQSTQPVFGAAGLAEVSPATTNPVLTLGEKWREGTRKRPSASFFRTVTTDEQQARYAAQYLYQDLRKRTAFVIDDRQGYGSGLVETFGEEYSALGGKVVGRGHVTPPETDFADLVADVRDSGADVVYFGGEYPEAGSLSKQLKAAGVDEPLVGGDGLYSDAFVDLAGGADADGDISTTVGVPAEELDSARAFVEDYREAGHRDGPALHGGYAYDSAWAIIQAVKAVAGERGGPLPEDARARVVEALRNVSFEGVTGRVSFDEYGDTTNRRVSVNRVEKGSWRFVTSGTAAGRPSA